MDRYYGLIELGVSAGVFKKAGNRIELPDETKQYAKTIYENPDKYFTNEVMESLENYAKDVFTYGGPEGNEDFDAEEEVAN